MSVRAMLMAAAGAQASAAAAYRYWRVFLQNNDGDSTYLAVSEIELRGSLGGADLTTTTTPVTALNSSGGFAVNVVDNGTATAWISGIKTSNWLLFDMGSAVFVAQVAMYPQAAALTRSPKDFTIQGSNDGTTFTDVKAFTNVTGWTAAWKTFDL